MKKTKGYPKQKPWVRGTHAEQKISVVRGLGPRHAENAQEGMSTDTVPAMLTPHEAVLNVNAAELAGRGTIEQLNKKGNKLAAQGVDLAQEGEEDVPFPLRVPPTGAEGLKAEQEQAHEELLQELEERMRARGVPPLRGLREGEQSGDKGHAIEGYRVLAQRGTSNMKPKKYQQGSNNTDPYVQAPQPASAGLQPGYQQPVQQPQLYPTPASFYPPQPGAPVQAQGGMPDVQQIGAPQGGYPWQMVPLTGGQLSALQKEMQKQGLDKDQIAGLTQAFKGFGSIGGQASPGAGAYQGAGSPSMVYGESGYPSAIPVGGYQGGISDIGYPPFVAPTAEYHADKGSTWVGPFDPAYMIPRY